MTETLVLPFWLELITAALLITGSLFALVGAVGLVRLKDYFQRMHPPALASIIYFSWLKDAAVLHAWLIPVLLSITVPVTTLLLARAALFRKRVAKEPVPEEVSSGCDSGN